MKNPNITPFAMSVATVTGKEFNTNYPNVCQITNLEEFRAAVEFDHCPAILVDGKRDQEHFKSVNVIMLDADNDAKKEPWDNPEDWLTIEDFHEAWGDYEYILLPSKSHMKDKPKPKGITRKARPKYHIYFPTSETITSGDEYLEKTEKLINDFRREDQYRYFDKSVKRSTGLSYGSPNRDQCIYNPGKSIMTYFGSSNFKENMKDDRVPLPKSNGSFPKSVGQELLAKHNWKYNDIIKHFKVEDFFGDIDKKRSSGTTWQVNCKIHGDENASMQVNKDDLCWFCHTCDEGGTAFKYFAKVNDMELEEVINSVCEKLKENKISNESAEDKVVNNINKKFAMLTDEGQSVVIFQTKKGILTKKNWQNFKLIMRGETLVEVNTVIKGVPQVIPRYKKNYEIWLDSELQRVYEQIAFDPAATELPPYGDEWNLWFDFETGVRGLDQYLNLEEYEKFSSDPDDEYYYLNYCNLYIDHIRDNICGVGTEDEQKRGFIYTMNWMASGIVDPTAQARTALIIKGKHGVGKNVFADQYLSLFGKKFGYPITSGETLTGKFNWPLKTCLLAVADEAVFSGDAAAKNKMKTWIKAKEMPYEAKGFDPVVLDNHTRFIFLSNNKIPVSLELGDRRYQVFECSDQYFERPDYFQPIINQWENGGGKAAFLYYLREVVAKDSGFSEYNFETEMINNEARSDLIKDSVPLMSWWDQCINDGAIMIDSPKRKESEQESDASILFEEDRTIIDDPDVMFNAFCSYLQGSRNAKPFDDRTGLFNELSKMGISLHSNGQKMNKGVRKPQWELAGYSKLKEEWATILKKNEY